MKKITLFFVLLIGYSHYLLAFSALDHEVICKIAYKELTPKVNAAVDRIMSRKTDDRFKTFRDSYGWPDMIDSQHSRKTKHYIKVPRYWYYIKYENCVIGDYCLFIAIRKDSSALRSSNSSHVEKLEALRLGLWEGAPFFIFPSMMVEEEFKYPWRGLDALHMIKPYTQFGIGAFRKQSGRTIIFPAPTL